MPGKVPKERSSVDICRQRLANQHLITPSMENASDVVRLLGAVQAQDYPAAKWGLAQRTRAATDANVEKEISDGSILRTHVLRPTWHFVAPEDIRWMLALTAPRVKAILSHYDRKLGLDAVVLRRSHAALTKALRNRKHLTRTELALVLTKAGIRADDTQRLARLVMHAELDGLVCNGPRRGKQFTYALLDERVPPGKKLERDIALHALAARYFSTRGPATEADFAWWSGLTKTDAKFAVRDLEPSLESAVIGGRRYWFPPTAPFARRKSSVARLLPNFDEYFIGLKDRSAMLTKLTSAGFQDRFGFLGGHAITIDGQIVGKWQRTVADKTVIVGLELFTRLSTTEQHAVEVEASRFAAFLEMPGRCEIRRFRDRLAGSTG